VVNQTIACHLPDPGFGRTRAAIAVCAANDLDDRVLQNILSVLPRNTLVHKKPKHGLGRDWYSAFTPASKALPPVRISMMISSSVMATSVLLLA